MSTWRLFVLRPFLLSIVVVPVLLLACRPEAGRPGSVQSEGGGSISVSGPAPAGVVQPPPAGAPQVNVILREWSLQAQPASVRAGQVYFLVDNQGPEDPHELVIIKTDTAPDRLPVTQGKVPENQVQMIGEVEGFAPRTKASGVFNLSVGQYAFICNIAEMEGGQLESHYQLGMRTAFTVTQ